MSERVVLVTGAGSGIGQAVAMAVASDGALVVCTDIKNAAKTKELIESQGGTAATYDLDVRDAARWELVVQSVCSDYGPITGLCQVAGVVSDGPDTVLDQSEDGWNRILDTNLKGIWYGMRAVLPQLIEAGGGSVVNVSSVAALIGMPNTATYSAAKAGILALSRQAAIEYSKKNVRVNTVAPGTIETPILGDITQETYDSMVAGTPVGRLGKPSDVGALVAHLLGPKGEFITGQNFVIDGGWTAN